MRNEKDGCRNTCLGIVHAVYRLGGSEGAGATTVIDVSTFGHDDAAIQAAHDALPSTGGELYFPAGTYELSNTVSITKPGVVLRGDGYDSKIFVKRTVNTFFTGLVAVRWKSATPRM